MTLIDISSDLAINRCWYREMLKILFGMLKNMPKINKTKGQVEAEISEAIIKFEKEYMGRGPDETKS